MNKYEKISDNEMLDTCTGEAVEAITVTIPKGSSVITPAQKEARIKSIKDQEKRALRRKANDELGPFYFLKKYNGLRDLSPENAGRLVFLLTYLDYNKGYLMSTQRTHIHKSDLKNIMHLSRNTIKKFWDEVHPSYIKETEDGLLVINDDIVRGALPKRTPDYFQKFYIKSIRGLYHATKVTQHRYLGYVFQALMFANHEYNILCLNTEEEDPDEIEPLSAGEFCEILGLSGNHFYKLVNIYSRILFEVDGQQQYFLTFICNNKDPNTMRMFINPRVVYAGSDFRKVEVLGLFSKQEPRKTKKNDVKKKNDQKSLSKRDIKKKKTNVA